jgi:hypothetical protein
MPPRVARVSAILWERHGTTVLARLSCSEAALDAAFDELIDRPLAVLRKVTACERARAN